MVQLDPDKTPGICLFVSVFICVFVFALWPYRTAFSSMSTIDEIQALLWRFPANVNHSIVRSNRLISISNLYGPAISHIKPAQKIDGRKSGSYSAVPLAENPCIRPLSI